ncbi:nuclear transport factor 2 family protein [Hydrogenophaga sp.]|uniref:nuclear transport factor 2 family protein n=1 Tax=Hydrogenophaga sp. TaxID=1904254 RepID=UPI003D1382E7
MKTHGTDPIDQLAVATLLQQYAWASDARDRTILEACFTSTATVWMSDADEELKKVVEGSDDIADWVIARHRAEFDAGHVRRHMLAFPLLTANSDHIIAKSYFAVLVRDQDGLRPAAMGWYEDELVNEYQAWRIRRRVVHIDKNDSASAPNQETKK